MSGGGEQRSPRVLRLRNTAVVIATAGTLVITGGCGSRAVASPARKPARPIARAAAEADCRRLAASACYAPQQLRAAYGIEPLLDRGVNGRGQTVVLQEFAMMPREPQQAVPVTDIRQDLALFDAVFGLPAVRLRVDTSLAGSASPWLASGEEVEPLNRTARSPARRRAQPTRGRIMAGSRWLCPHSLEEQND